MSDLPNTHGRPTALLAMEPGDWFRLAAVIAVAVALRIFFYTGFFGSDEVTYVGTAATIVSGDWRASDYIGATRYGMNLPLALSIYLFGLSEASANLWPLLTSIGEVAIVFAIARWLWGSRAAYISAGLLALLPLHVHFAGRMMADSPLAFFLSLSVALMLQAAHSRSALTYLAAGLAWGGAFWVKESVAILYLPVLLFLTLYRNHLRGPWLWLAVGSGLAVLVNCALMAYVADNPLHIFAVMKKATLRASGMSLETSPWYYLRYLFVDVTHTFLLGYLALGAIALYARCFLRDKLAESGAQFVVVWALLMVGMFSLAIVSASPVKLIMKQTNYMLIFAGPLTLLGGWFLASLPQRFFVAVAGVVVCGSLVLVALEQQVIRVFTANSKAAYSFLRDQPNSFLLGTTNNQRAIYFYSLMDAHEESLDRFASFGDMTRQDAASPAADLAHRTAGKAVFALLDLQSVDWGYKPGGVRKLADVPKCWVAAGTLAPAGLGTGAWIVKSLQAAGRLLPGSVRQGFESNLQQVSTPKPAYLFSLDPACLAASLQ